MTDKKTVLFLCTTNSCRSQMAEAFLKKHAGDRFDIYSAGLDPAEIHPMTRQVMAEVALDLHGQYAKGVRVYLGQFFVHYLIIVCAGANESCPKLWPSVGKRLFWPFDDPAYFQGTDDERRQQFRRLRDRIEERILGWLKDLENEEK
ncbi:MAG TPA: arsenate reductase ArsC [Phycisphaerales bacterium]|nr:arsenate reductase ArsC [Phycisphaerales bacterium]